MLAHKELVDMGVNATIFTKNEALGFSHWQFKQDPPISVFGGQQNSKLTTYPVHWKYLDRNMGVFHLLQPIYSVTCEKEISWKTWVLSSQQMTMSSMMVPWFIGRWAWQIATLLMTHYQNSKNNCFPRFLDIPPLSSIAIKCLSDQDIWVEQWPIIEPNLSILKNLLTKQLDLGHTEPSTRRTNTPIFAIPRKLGKYQLLEDL